MTTQPSLFTPSRPVPAPDGRAEYDAYYTPAACAMACARVLAEYVTPARVLEPSVGGGAWVQAVREVWPRARVAALDLDPSAPGLDLADESWVGDYTTEPLPEVDLVLGNRPYHLDGPAWFDRSLAVAPAVAYLERSTVLGSATRAEWWAAHPPAVVWTLTKRPRWEGRSTHESGDTVDSVLVLWLRGVTDTRHRWLRWEPR